MAKHSEGRVGDFEIWNEPHNFAFMKHYGGGLFVNAPWTGDFQWKWRQQRVSGKRC